MKKSDKTFVEKLVELEKPNPCYKEKYKKEIKSMLEKKLNYFWRAVFAILSVLGLLATLQFFEMSSKKFGTSLGEFIRIVAILGCVLTLSWTATMGWIAIKGKLNLRKYPARIAAIGIALGFFFISYFLFVFIFPIALNEPMDYRSIIGIYLALIGFFFVVIIALSLIISTLNSLGYRTREKLLEIELHIAELSEKLESKK